ncbi:DNA-binding transcriptional regulator, ArsR family [Chitinophaga terrae (ex Kim and Jung 2007)]|jgi:DNA-binding transcriptional ArsR family regulator|uniref:DNA-binding transcriptional regulator, ArsR family n=1 Tax=Chitinophaga terrae (ex Kim and Jung 2007) TaxID=408074 RepID=A0A1H4BA72_9BACT|nr:metalloregulator ArsR/SmtB family transcription factor [Chitinophaga terrae (ex Kim and Jung 2007)]GEP92099.1 transcriptional regulator [Chitinophaga terrae (ex Kim and Jung 2007)]SEA45041.1 DNA-binding transcriptional regulator, ArsR family [Chitinophaga terrae (ex Kim and Jung 2007)]
MDVFQAIADPTRRQIISLLANASLPVNAVAHNFDMTRPAISKHLRILTKCGLVTIRKEGRERYCTVVLSQLAAIGHWVIQYQHFWTDVPDPAAYRRPTYKRRKDDQ